MYQTLFPPEALQGKDINSLVAAMQDMMGAKCQVSTRVIVETDNLDASLIFDGLRDRLVAAIQGKGKPARKEVHVSPKTLLKRAEKNARARGKAADAGSYESGYYYRNVATRELISVRALPGMLQRHEITPQTRLEHARRGTFVVMEADNPDDPYEAIPEPKGE